MKIGLVAAMEELTADGAKLSDQLEPIAKEQKVIEAPMDKEEAASQITNNENVDEIAHGDGKPAEAVADGSELSEQLDSIEKEQKVIEATMESLLDQKALLTVRYHAALEAYQNLLIGRQLSGQGKLTYLNKQRKAMGLDAVTSLESYEQTVRLTAKAIAVAKKHL